MKYKATEKNELLPTGAEFTFDCDNRMIPTLALYTDGWQVEQQLQNEWINSGWCEEIQEPEFTLNQLKERAVAFTCDMITGEVDASMTIHYAKEFDEWAKDKGI